MALEIYKRSLNVYIKPTKRNEEFILTIIDDESGCSLQSTLPYLPDEHSEFNEVVGNEIYSWVEIAMEHFNEGEEE